MLKCFVLLIININLNNHHNRNIEPWYSPEQITQSAYTLNGLRFNTDFEEWFVPEYARGVGKKDYTALCGIAAEVMVDLFGDLWNSIETAVKLPRGRKKYQVKILLFFRIKAHICPLPENKLHYAYSQISILSSFRLDIQFL